MKTGIAFPDYIKTEKTKKGHRFFEKSYSMRSSFIPLILVVALGIIFARLFFLQIIKGDYYKSLSDGNRIRTVTIYAPRGIIFDRNGRPLVFNVPGFRETVDGKTKIIDNSQALSLIAQGKKDLEIDSLRSYPYKEILAHTLGYIGQISVDGLEKKEFIDYKMGDLVGKTGIEQEYERGLKGIDGKSLVEVDSVGRIIRKLGQTDPTPGENIATTLDIGLQKAVYSAMGNVNKGAAIVSTPTGEILAFVSKPSFDPNLFTLPDSYETASESAYKNIYEILLDGEGQPLINRGIQGEYPPGSTFKIIVAAAGLEEKIINENFEVEDIGILHVGNFSFSNWYYTQYGKTEGLVNVVKALKRSNDIFFYKASEKIGVDKISSNAEKFGVGKRLGIDLGGEEEGLLPTVSWKKKAIGEPWFLGDTYHYGIGQGYLLTTPLQVNLWTSVIANDGVLPTPHLLKNQKSILRQDGYRTVTRQAQDKNQKFLSEKTISLIRQGMVESCSPGGVAWPLFKLKISAKGGSASGGKNEKLKIDGRNFLEVPVSSGSADMREVSIACKTGTAEAGGKNDLPHAWITLFAPAYNPEIVVTILSENSGEGSNIAAPIAKKILEEWFGR